MKEVFIDMKRCTACKSCEIACAVSHSESKDLFSAIYETPSPQTRIQVEGADSYSYPVRCMHCSDAACIMACPNRAMSRDLETGAVYVNEEKCMGCFMCAMVCPFGSISANPIKKVALKCDFCIPRQKEGKQPACAEACPTDALLFGEESEIAKTKRSKTAKAMLDAISRERKFKPELNPLENLRKVGGH